MKKFVTKFLLFMIASVFICLSPLFTNTVKADSGIVDPVIYKADGVTPAEEGEDKDYILDNDYKQIYLKKSDLIITKTAYDSQSNVYYSIIDCCEEPGQHIFTLRNFNFDGKTQNQILFDFSGKKVKLIVDSCNINITNDDDFQCVIAGTDLEIIDGPMEGNNLKISCNNTYCSLIKIFGNYENDDINPQLILGNNNEFNISLETCDNEYHDSRIIYCDCRGSGSLKINEGTHLSGNRSIEGFSDYELSGKMDISTDGIPCFVLKNNTQSFVINLSANILLSSSNLDDIDPTGNYFYREILVCNDLILLGSTEVCKRKQCTEDVELNYENRFSIVSNSEYPKTLYITGYPDDPDDPDDPDPDDPDPDDPDPDDPNPDDPDSDDPDPDDPNPDDPTPDDPDPDDPKTKIESDPLNLKLSDMINRASKNNGYSVIKFTDYDGNDCLTRDNLKLLDENPNAVLVLDYTFHDINTDKDIHVHAVINKAILPYILNENIIYYGPAKMSGFVQYYNMLPLEIRNMNL